MWLTEHRTLSEPKKTPIPDSWGQNVSKFLKRKEVGSKSPLYRSLQGFYSLLKVIETLKVIRSELIDYFNSFHSISVLNRSYSALTFVLANQNDTFCDILDTNSRWFYYVQKGLNYRWNIRPKTSLKQSISCFLLSIKMQSWLSIKFSIQ